jgi:DNA-binding MarR family transcriptional regulator
MQAESGESAGLATALIRLCFVVQRSFGDVSRRHGLTPQHAQLLGVLARGPVGMAELGEALNLEKSSLTGLIDRAEARALVARVRDDGDRRTCRVALTESGAELVVHFRDDVSRELNALAADLPESTRHELTGAIWEIISSQDVSAIFGCASLQRAESAAGHNRRPLREL